LNARLASYSTLTQSSHDIAVAHIQPALEARRARQRAAAASNSAAEPPAAPPRPAPRRAAAANAPSGQRLVIEELSAAKLLRAVYSERQLEAVLVDFWFNHFNVFAGKGRVPTYITEYEREAIRPHVLGHFRDLLEATAKSPAMLFYLDNWQSAAPEGAATAARARGARRPLRPARPAAPNRRPRGLNENYGRELMELHTLGVDGGYTQQDVTEVARAFTGWTIDQRTQEFRFVPALHDAGAKVVLGQAIKAGGGIEDGERVLDILANHPATARHIARQLAQRFVSDEPPQTLVDRAAARFRDTNGDLREVVRTIVTSPEFFAADARHAKIKTPFEFVASAARAAQAEIVEPRPLLRALQQMGMPLYGCLPPTGYADTADAWVSSGGLVARINFANDLGNGRARGVRLSAPGDPKQLALLLGSPDFQRR
jgi:uncharacterized protein (DUF1800 family)